MHRLTSLLNWLLQLNHSTSRLVERRLPQARVHTQVLYDQLVAEYMNSEPNQVILDVGAGTCCHFAKYRRPELGTRIIGLDISQSQLDLNRDVDEKVIANASDGLPFPDSEIDLVVSRSVLEHLKDVSPFLRETRRILKHGGYTIHVFSSRFAPYSIINQLLPNWLSNRILHVCYPGSEGVLGFPAFYDHCYLSGMEDLLLQHGFVVVRSRVTYYQADYFSFFFPLYLINVIYELAIRKVGAENLAAAVVIVARKS